MSSVASTSVADAVGGAEGTSAAAAKWQSVAGIVQEREDRLPMGEAMMKWTRIYTLFSADSEGSQDEVFLAVNHYFCVNGCSDRGKYRRPIRTGGGIEVEAGRVVAITGKQEGEIRQFMRGLMKKSYECLKHAPSIRGDAALCSAAESAGVPRSMCWLMADWLGGCEFFTPEESQLWERVKRDKIHASNERRRTAASLSKVEDDVVIARDVGAAATEAPTHQLGNW